MLAVDITHSFSFTISDVNYFVQLGKIKGQDEWHLYVNNERQVISESEYNECLDEDLAVEKLVSKVISGK
ncbi:hypothetical protein [Vibrio diabolicus]|uniref:hypothetical protein n=1 Tax=Vibrio diabolicus TaxID=50719 RepID=UPI00375074BF